jgi:hypothetical protein
VLPARSVIRMNPNCLIDSAPINNLRVGNALLPEDSLHTLDIVPYKVQGVGDRRNKGFIQQKSVPM